MQQILRKDARKALRKEGIVEFEISDSETSDTEPKVEVDTRTKKRIVAPKALLNPVGYITDREGRSKRPQDLARKRPARTTCTKGS